MASTRKADGWKPTSPNSAVPQAVEVQTGPIVVPQRETGLTPYEIMLSESQERMLLVAEKEREEEISSIFRRWGLDAVVIGEVIAEATLRVRDHGSIVAEIPNEALTDELVGYGAVAASPVSYHAPVVAVFDL